jgi:hypothetical protein
MSPSRSSGLQLDHVVPWGRSLDEYRKMFALTERELPYRLLDCGGGPSSFNVEWTEQGGNVLSCDPIYAFTAAEIEQRIQATYPVIIEGVRANRDRYVWTTIPTPEALGEIRLNAMQRFLQDFTTGQANQRYVTAALPNLPFGDRTFDLALCSHLLFTYGEQLGEAFHQEALQELGRVAREIRVFPLLTLAGDPSPFLDRILSQLSTLGYQWDICSVCYEFQTGGNQLLRLYAPEVNSRAQMP